MSLSRRDRAGAGSGWDRVRVEARALDLETGPAEHTHHTIVVNIVKFKKIGRQQGSKAPVDRLDQK